MEDCILADICAYSGMNAVKEIKDMEKKIDNSYAIIFAIDE